ncbi:hypothetical protein [Nocardiopsis oceani]
MAFVAQHPEQVLLLANQWAESLKAEGALEARAESVLHILDKLGMTVSDETRERIKSCRDLEQLYVWFDRAIDVWLDRSLDIAYIDELFED